MRGLLFFITRIIHINPQDVSMQCNFSTVFRHFTISHQMVEFVHSLRIKHTKYGHLTVCTEVFRSYRPKLSQYTVHEPTVIHVAEHIRFQHTNFVKNMVFSSTSKKGVIRTPCEKRLTVNGLSRQ